MNKTTEALNLAEALENDAKEHREVSYGLDCPPERTANWKHALNCEAAARLIREALAEQSKCACDSPAWCTKYNKCNREVLGLPKAQPVKQEPVACPVCCNGYLVKRTEEYCNSCGSVCVSPQTIQENVANKKAAPVRTKELTDDEKFLLIEAYETQKYKWTAMDFIDAVIAADREKNK